MRTVIGVLFVVVLLPAARLSAQSALPVRPGDRVRVEADHVRGVFTVVSVEERALTVRRGEGAAPIALQLGDLDRLEVDRGLRSRRRAAGRGAVFGAVGGGLAGIAAGLADGDDRCDAGSWCLFQMSAGEKAVIGGLVFAGAGTLVGVAIGTLLPGREWEPCTLPLDVGIRTSAGGGLGLGAAIRF